MTGRTNLLAFESLFADQKILTGPEVGVSASFVPGTVMGMLPPQANEAGGLLVLDEAFQLAAGVDRRFVGIPRGARFFSTLLRLLVRERIQKRLGNPIITLALGFPGF